MKAESLFGYIVDINCLRTWSFTDSFERARNHTKECSIKGKSLESGFALIQDDHTIALLDQEATPLILESINISNNNIGIRLRVERERLPNNTMKTILVTEI